MSDLTGPLVHGQKTVGTSAVQLQSASWPLCRQVTVKADDDIGTESVYVGLVGVTTSTGFRLKAGQAIAVTADDVNQVYVIGSAASLKAHYIGS